MKEPIFINKAKVKNPDEDFIGTLKEFKPAGNGREIPVIKPAFLKPKKVLTAPFRSGEKELDYLKVKEEDKVRYSVGGFEIIEIVNKSNIPNVHPEDELTTDDNTEEVKKLNRMVENLTKEKKTLEKQVQRLKDEEEEKEKAKRRKQTRKKLRCERCGVESTENQWEDNGGTCPSCDRGIMERAMEVQV